MVRRRNNTHLAKELCAFLTGLNLSSRLPRKGVAGLGESFLNLLRFSSRLVHLTFLMVVMSATVAQDYCVVCRQAQSLEQLCAFDGTN